MPDIYITSTVSLCVPVFDLFLSTNTMSMGTLLPKYNLLEHGMYDLRQ